MHHDLKIAPAYIEATLQGDKQFEIRFNDRGFQKGDTVKLQEWDGVFKAREYDCEITYVTSFGQKDNWVVFGHKPTTIT